MTLHLRIVRNEYGFMPQRRFFFMWFDLCLRFASFKTLDEAECALYNHYKRYKKFNHVVKKFTIDSVHVTEEYK